jgi:hypothetical protein
MNGASQVPWRGRRAGCRAARAESAADAREGREVGVSAHAVL